ncbi:site-2 protease family protein [Candidatus Hydrogenedentota bacterium]
MGQTPFEIGVQIAAFLFSLSFHEFAHGWMANRCGDPTARMLGRLTMNPIAHMDPIGTVLMPLIAIFTSFPVIGWAKPVPVNPINFQKPSRDDILVSAAGPGSNMLLVLISIVVIRLCVLAGMSFGSPISTFLSYFLIINGYLMLFNLIPIPPLDGSHILANIAPPWVAEAMDRLGGFGFIIILVLIQLPIFKVIMLLPMVVLLWLAGLY